MISKKIILTIAAFALLLIGAACGLTGCIGESGGTNTPAGGDVVKGLPPDPGKAGKATLAGIDSDNDGVRDDIQRYIVLNNLDSAKIRAALTRYAKAMQDEILSVEKGKSASIDATYTGNRAQECIWFTLGSIESGEDYRISLEKEMLNTPDRIATYKKYNVSLSGQSFGLTPDDQLATNCAIDPTK